MKPTLLIGDHILVNKFNYGVKLPYLRNTLIPFGQPQRGDIVVFIYPEDRSKDFIKRVIAVGGDTVEIRNKKIFLNGQPLNDPYGVHVDDMIYPRRSSPATTSDRSRSRKARSSSWATTATRATTAVSGASSNSRTSSGRP